MGVLPAGHQRRRLIATFLLGLLLSALVTLPGMLLLRPF
jgi:hypothetical protein